MIVIKRLARNVGVAFAILEFFALPASAQQYFFGESTTGDNFNRASLVPGQNAESTFLSYLTGVGTETFDTGFSRGATAPLTLDFGVAGNATLNGETCVSNWTWSACTNPVTSSGAAWNGTNGFGRYSVNPGTEQNPGMYWEAVTGGEDDFWITFSNPIAAFGFWGIDIGDFEGSLSLAFLNGGSLIRTVTPAYTPGSDANGAAFFWGIIDTASPFDEVQFVVTGGGVDVFAFDNMTIGTREQVQVPEPASLILLGTGLFGLVMVGRRRSDEE